LLIVTLFILGSLYMRRQHVRPVPRQPLRRGDRLGQVAIATVLEKFEQRMTAKEGTSLLTNERVVTGRKSEASQTSAARH
jgi:hypothetical protein